MEYSKSSLIICNSPSEHLVAELVNIYNSQKTNINFSVKLLQNFLLYTVSFIVFLAAKCFSTAILTRNFHYLTYILVESDNTYRIFLISCGQLSLQLVFSFLFFLHSGQQLSVLQVLRRKFFFVLFHLLSKIDQTLIGRRKLSIQAINCLVFVFALRLQRVDLETQIISSVVDEICQLIFL